MSQSLWKSVTWPSESLTAMSLVYTGGLLSGVWMGNQMMSFLARLRSKPLSYAKRFFLVSGFGVFTAGLHLWGSRLITNKQFFLHASVGMVTPIVAMVATSYTVTDDDNDDCHVAKLE